jgi:predicted transcriptional regulator
MTPEQRATIIKPQATLTKISIKADVFFNVAQFTSMGLVKEHGKTHDNKTNWVLTEKAKRILNIQL